VFFIIINPIATGPAPAEMLSLEELHLLMHAGDSIPLGMFLTFELWNVCCDV
jgi:hypothetical protein